MRALAISWVMLYHAGKFDPVSDSSWPVAFGWMGVDLVPVLSGFLIAGQLLRPLTCGRALNYGRFMGRRILRTMPAYLVVVALYFVFPALRDRPHIRPLWQFLTFNKNLLINPSVRKAFS